MLQEQRGGSAYWRHRPLFKIVYIMTDPKPPTPRPKFESYRPSEERAGPLRRRKEAQTFSPPAREGREPAFASTAKPSLQGGDRGNERDLAGLPELSLETVRPLAAAAGGAPVRSRLSPGRLAATAGLVLAGVAGIAALLFSFVSPGTLLKAELAEAVKARTGRDLVLGGPVTFSLFPAPAAVLNQISLPGASGERDGALLTVERAEARVAFWPLLIGRIEIEDLVLFKPVLALRTSRDGHRNWRFADASSETSAYRTLGALFPPKAARPASPPLSVEGPRLAFSAITAPAGAPVVRRLRIEDGTLRYADERKGVAYELAALNTTVALADTLGPLPLKGTAAIGAEPVTFEATAAAPAELARSGVSPFSATVTGRLLTTTLDGTLKLEETPSFSGTFRTRGDSASALAAWVGTRLPDSPAAGAFSAEGRLSAEPGTLKLEDVTADVGGTAVSGSLSVERGPERPMIRGALKAAALDLRAWHNAAQNSVAPASGAPAAPGSSTASPKNAAGDQGAAQDGTPAKPPLKHRGWSEEPINWSFLGAADAGLKISLGHLISEGLEAGPGEVTLSLAGRKLTVSSDDMHFYRGRLRWTFIADGSGSPAAAPHLALDAEAQGIDAGAFLRAHAGLPWLSGTGSFSLAVTGNGDSERRFAESLAGTAKIALKDGAVSGIDVGGIAEKASEGRFGNLTAKNPGGKTGFSTMTASFAIRNGIAGNKDLAVTGPLVQAAGAGRVLLGTREIDYTLRPRIVANLPGGGNAPERQTSLEIPVRAHGPWDKPQFSVDFGGFAAEPDKAVSVIKEIGKKLKGKNLGDIVRGILGNGGRGGNGGGETVRP